MLRMSRVIRNAAAVVYPHKPHAYEPHSIPLERSSIPYQYRASEVSDCPKVSLMNLSIRELQPLLQNGQLTPRHLFKLTERVACFLEDYRFFAKNAFTEETFSATNMERVLDDATRRLASGADVTLLTGMLFTVKDAVSTSGLLQTVGSKYYSLTAPVDTTSHQLVQVAEAAGAVCIGQTTSAELNSKVDSFSPLHGFTRNPHDPEKSAGGSSGGAAASIASGIGQFAFGTDAVGCTRGASAMNGVVGFKPPRDWGSMWAHGRMSNGIITRRVEDLATVVSTLRQQSCSPEISPPASQLCVGMTLTLGTRDLVDPQIKDMVLARIRRFQERTKYAVTDLDSVNGAALNQIHDGDFGFKYAHQMFIGLLQQSVQQWRLVLRDHRAALLGKLQLPECTTEDRLLANILHIDPNFNLAALCDFDTMNGHMLLSSSELSAVETTMKQGVADVFANHDILITPAIPCRSYKVNEYHGKGDRERPWKVFTPYAFLFPFNITGHAAVTVPIGYDDDSMPVGIQVVAKRTAELGNTATEVMNNLLWVAHNLTKSNEEMRPWWPLMQHGVEGLPCSKDASVSRILRAVGQRGPHDAV